MYVSANCVYAEGCPVFSKIVFIKFTTYKFSFCWLDVDMLADPWELPVVEPPGFEEALKIDETKSRV